MFKKIFESLSVIGIIITIGSILFAIFIIGPMLALATTVIVGFLAITVLVFPAEKKTRKNKTTD